VVTKDVLPKKVRQSWPAGSRFRRRSRKPGSKLLHKDYFLRAIAKPLVMILVLSAEEAEGNAFNQVHLSVSCSRQILQRDHSAHPKLGWRHGGSTPRLSSFVVVLIIGICLRCYLQVSTIAITIQSALAIDNEMLSAIDRKDSYQRSLSVLSKVLIRPPAAYPENSTTLSNISSFA